MCAGDSACSIPPQTIAAECLDVIRDWTPKLAKALKVVGLINIQYCVQDDLARPRLSRAGCESGSVLTAMPLRVMWNFLFCHAPLC